MDNLTSDILIIGGGPIGSYAALRLTKMGYSVIIVEKHTEIGHPSQCAGLVNHRLFDLPEMDHLQEKVILNEIFGANIYSPSGAILPLRGTSRKAFSIDRSKFDRNLFLKSVDLGATPLIGQKAIKIVKNGHWMVITKGIQGKVQIKGEIVLGCDGPGSFIRNEHFKNQCNETLPGVSIETELLEGTRPNNIVGVFTGKKIAKGFFAWAIPAGGSCTIRLGLLAENGEELRSGLSHFLSDTKMKDFISFPKEKEIRLGTISEVYGPVPIGFPPVMVKDNILLLGDAAGMAKPTSGGGIYPGLLSVDMLCKTIQRTNELNNIALKDYVDQWMRGFGGEQEKARIFRKIILQVKDNEIDDILSKLSEDKLVSIINQEGDIDHPLTLALRLISIEPKLLKLIPRFLPYLKKISK